MEHNNQLDPLNIGTRIEDLANLRAEWFNGKGMSPDRMDLKTLAEQFEKFIGADLALSALDPTPEGGVLAEWTLETGRSRRRFNCPA